MPIAEGNLLLSSITRLILGYVGSVETQTYECYGDLVTGLESSELHPVDAKNAVNSYFDELITLNCEKFRELTNE